MEAIFQYGARNNNFPHVGIYSTDFRDFRVKFYIFKYDEFIHDTTIYAKQMKQRQSHAT